MMGEILGDLGDDFGFGFLCERVPQVAENFRRRHDDELLERLRLSSPIDPVRDRGGETLLFDQHVIGERFSPSAAFANGGGGEVRPCLMHVP